MTLVQRIRSTISGIIILVCSVLLVIRPEDGYRIVVLILSVSIIIAGIKKLIYYFTMARYMVDGKIVLYLGIILFDAGIFTYMLTDVPSLYIMIYLVICHLFSGTISIMRALESKKLKAHLWKHILMEGITNISIAIVCIMFRNRHDILVYVYSLGLMYFGIVKIANSFKKTAIVYIQ